MISVILFAFGLFHARNDYEAKWKLSEKAERRDKAAMVLETFGKESLCLWVYIISSYDRFSKQSLS